MRRIGMRRSLAAFAAVGLVGCAGGGADMPDHRYDLGIEAPSAQMPALELREVRALRPFDGVGMYYRLAYRNGTELARYAQARWAAPPAQLVRKQLARAMRTGSPRCALDVELQEFSQVFSAPNTSSARLELIASLDTPDGGSRTIALRLSEKGGGASASEGVGAMQRAVTHAVDDLAKWVDGIAACRG
jgi:cholesterol transport system auxiliary component